MAYNNIRETYSVKSSRRENTKFKTVLENTVPHVRNTVGREDLREKQQRNRERERERKGKRERERKRG